MALFSNSGDKKGDNSPSTAEITDPKLQQEIFDKIDGDITKAMKAMAEQDVTISDVSPQAAAANLKGTAGIQNAKQAQQGVASPAA